MLLGTISGIETIGGLKLTIDGESSPTTKNYKYLASYVPKTGDRVLIEEVGDSYVVLGKVISDTSESAGRFMTGFNITSMGIQANLADQSEQNRVHVLSANCVWNRTHTDRSYGIVFKEENQQYYISTVGDAPWKKITT